MADLTPVSMPRSPSEHQVYRPLSVVALTAVGLAGVYAASVAVLGLMSLFSGTPMFMGVWIFLAPIAAFTLALVGRQQIRRSEGTLGGDKLITWAWWLSVLFGLGYATFYATTYFVVKNQADNTTQRFFDLLRQGDINRAFVWTLDPLQRKNVNPEDTEAMFERFGIPRGEGRMGPLSMFQHNDLVRLLTQGGPSTQIVSLGVKDWAFEKGGYSVIQTFRLKTAEGDFQIQVGARGTESKQFDGRQWQVALESTQMLGSPHLSTLGQAIDSWRDQSRRLAANWVEQRNQGNVLGDYLDTLPPADREATLAAFFRGVGLTVMAAGASTALAGPLPGVGHFSFINDPVPLCAAYLPGFKEYAAGGLIRDKGFQSLKKYKEEIPQAIRTAFIQPSIIVFQIQDKGKGRPLPPEEGKPLRFLHDLEIGIFPSGQPTEMPKYRCEAALIVESDTAELAPGKIPKWRLVGIQLISGGTPPQDPKAGQKKGAPGGMGGGPGLGMGPQ